MRFELQPSLDGLIQRTKPACDVRFDLRQALHRRPTAGRGLEILHETGEFRRALLKLGLHTDPLFLAGASYQRRGGGGNLRAFFGESHRHRHGRDTIARNATDGLLDGVEGVPRDGGGQDGKPGHDKERQEQLGFDPEHRPGASAVGRSSRIGSRCGRWAAGIDCVHCMRESTAIFERFISRGDPLP